MTASGWWRDVFTGGCTRSPEQFELAPLGLDQGWAQDRAFGERQWAPVGGDDERSQPFDAPRQPAEVVEAQPPLPPRPDHGVDRFDPHARHAKQHLARRAVDIDREIGAMLQRPGGLGIDIERQHAIIGRVGDFAGIEAVETHQPVGLVQPVFAHQRRTDQRQDGRGIGDRREGTVIDPPQPEIAVQRRRAGDDIGVGGGIGPDDHLRRLAGRRKFRRASVFLPRIEVVVDALFQLAHRRADAGRALFGGELGQAAFGRQFDVDRQAIGVKPGRLDQRRIGIGNGLEMDIAAKVMLEPQRLRHQHELLHGVVGRADYTRRQEQPLDIISLVEVERQRDDLIGSEARPANVR